MPSQLYNNVTDSLSSSVTSSDTSFTVSDGSKFPEVSEGDYIPLYIIRASDNAYEIVHVTSISGDELTVTRAEEGTDPLVFNSGDSVQIRPTRQSLLEMDVSNSSVTTSTGEQTLSEALDRRAINISSIAGLKLVPSSVISEGQHALVSSYYLGSPEGGGVFYWSPEREDNDNGGTIIAPSGEAVGRWIRVNGREITPETFGGGNSRTGEENADAINRALAFIHESGGGSLVFNGGTYELGGGLNIGSNTSVFGNGSRIVRKHDSGFFYTDYNIGPTVGGYDGHKNTSICDLTLDGNSIEIYQAFNFSEVSHTENMRFSNVTFLDGVRAHAIDLSASRNTVIENCKFLGFAKDKVSPDGYGESEDGLAVDRDFSEAIQIDPCLTGSSSIGAQDGTPLEGVVISGCVFGPNPERNDSTFASWGAGVGGHVGLHDQWHKNIHIKGCEFREFDYYAIAVYKWDSAIINCNSFIDCNRGIRIQAVGYQSSSAEDISGNPSGVGQPNYNIDISNNVFVNVVNEAVYAIPVTYDVATPEYVFYNEGVKVSNNTITGGGYTSGASAAIRLYSCSNTIIDHNVIRGFNKGIYLSLCHNLSIAGNVVRSVDDNGIEANMQDSNIQDDLQIATNSFNINVSENLLSNTGRNGISIVGNIQNVMINSNNIHNPNISAGEYYGIFIGGGVSDAWVIGSFVHGTTSVPYSAIATSTTSFINIGTNCFSLGNLGKVQNSSASADLGIYTPG